MDEETVRKLMREAIDKLQTEISAIRTGRATSGMVEEIEIDAYGGAQRLKIKEMASINAQDPQSLIIEAWDKSVVGEIRKGIQAANVGLNPSLDGDIIRISVPPMTTEDRERNVSLLRAKLEAGKVTVRQIRGDYMKKIKHSLDDKQISEDVARSQEKELQRIVDENVKSIEEIGTQKEGELLTI